MSTEIKKETLSLKWGTLKRWSFNESGPAFAVLEKYNKERGLSLSVMTDEIHKEFICEVINAVNADTILLDWDNKSVSKEEAKKYVMVYGTES